MPSDCTGIKTGYQVDIKTASGRYLPDRHHSSCLFSVSATGEKEWIFCGDTLDDMRAWQLALEQARLLIVRPPAPRPTHNPLLSPLAFRCPTTSTFNPYLPWSLMYPHYPPVYPSPFMTSFDPLTLSSFTPLIPPSVPLPSSLPSSVDASLPPPLTTPYLTPPANTLLTQPLPHLSQPPSVIPPSSIPSTPNQTDLGGAIGRSFTTFPSNGSATAALTTLPWVSVPPYGYWW